MFLPFDDSPPFSRSQQNVVNHFQWQPRFHTHGKWPGPAGSSIGLLTLHTVGNNCRPLIILITAIIYASCQYHNKEDKLRSVTNLLTICYHAMECIEIEHVVLAQFYIRNRPEYFVLCLSNIYCLMFNTFFSCMGLIKVFLVWKH